MNTFQANQCLLFFFFALLFSCKEEEPGKQYVENILSRSEILLAKDSANKSMAVVDSLTDKFSSLSTQDQFKYYSIKSDVYRNHNFPGFNLAKGELFADSAVYTIERANMELVMKGEYLNILRKQGLYYFERRRYNESLRYIYSLKLFAKKMNDTCLLGECNNILGTLYFRQSNYNESLVHYKDALDVLFIEKCYGRKEKFNGTQAIMDNIGLCYSRMGKQDSAIQYYKMAESFIQQNRNMYLPDTVYPDIVLSVVYGNRGYAYELKDDYENAVVYYQKAIPLGRKEEGSLDVLSNETRLAAVYLKSADIEKAEPVLKTVEGKIPITAQRIWRDWYETMALLASKKNDTEQQLYYLQKQYALKDSLAAEEKKMTGKDLGAEYNVIEKRHEIDLLKQNNYIQRIYIIAASVTGGLFILLAIVIFRNLKRSRKMIKIMENLNTELTNREEKLKQLIAEQAIIKEKERQDELSLQELRLQMEYNEEIVKHRSKISNDMHDGLSSSLAALRYYVEDIKSKATDADSRQLLDGLGDEVQSIYESARSYMHNLKNNTSAQHNIVTFLTEIKQKFSEKNLLMIHLDIDIEKIRSVLTPIQHDHLYHIIKEGISNIIKHAYATEISIMIGFAGDTCRFTVSDNGRGFSQQAITYGMGLKSIRARLLELDGTLQFRPIEKGTILEGIFPVYF